MQKRNGFGLLEIIIIIVITAVVSSITTGVIMLNRNTGINSNLTLNNDEYLQDFIEVYETIISKYYDEVDKKGMLEAAEEGMLNFLGDKYTTYLEDTEYNNIIDELSDTYYGIGVRISNNEILKITLNSPAEKAGLQVGDLIIKINETVVTNLSAEEITKLIKNNDEKVVVLTIKRGNEQLEFTIEKTELLNETVEYNLIDSTKIGYLSISSFSENVDEQVDTALTELEAQGMESLIIDVRDNVGGYLSSGEKTAALFLEKGKTIYSLESNNNTYTYKDETNDRKNYEIVMLINETTASSAEILTAALKESYGATLVGTKSYGKGMVQQVLSLNSGDSVKVSTAKWLTPNGVCIDGIGINPDYNVEYFPNEMYDSQLQKAIELLS